MLARQRATTAAAQTATAEHVWLMRKNGRQIDCSLLGHGEYGWDVLLWRNGDWFYGRRWVMRADALTEAEELRQELERDEWLLCR